jgi:hypothetical protein
MQLCTKYRSVLDVVTKNKNRRQRKNASARVSTAGGYLLLKKVISLSLTTAALFSAYFSAGAWKVSG